MASSKSKPDRKEASYTPSIEFQYLTREPLKEYWGEWVAVVGEVVVAHSASALDVHSKAMEARPGSKPLFAQIPRPEQAFISVWAL